MVVLDMSKSMEETDMAPRDDRLDAAQYVIRQFIGKRDGRQAVALGQRDDVLNRERRV